MKKNQTSEFSSKNFIPLDNQLSVQSRAINEFAKWPSWHRLFFKKVDFFKGNKNIFFLNNRPMIFGLFAFFLPAFADVIFFELFPFSKHLSFAKNMAPNRRKVMGKYKKVGILISDVGFYMFNTIKMIWINSKNCEVKF